MNIFKNFMAFKQHGFLLLLRSHLSIFIFVLFVLSVSQVTFSQGNEFTEANGWSRHPNGGGLVHRDANVSPSASIGPDVRIYGGTINKDADIRGRVVVRGGTINKGLIYGNAVITGGIIEDGTVTGNAVVRGGVISGSADVNGGTIFDGRIEGGRIDGNVEINGGTIKGGFISGNAKVSGGIIEDGIIGENAEVSGGRITDGNIHGDVKISGGLIEDGRFAGEVEINGGVIKDGYIHGDAKINGGIISGETTDIFGGTISGNTEVSGGVIYGRADIRGGKISENARISGGTIYEGAEVSGGRVSGRAEVKGKITGGRVDGNAVIPKGVEVREGMHINDDRLLSRFDKLKIRTRTPLLFKLLAVGGTVLSILKAKGASASETIVNALGEAANEVALGGDLAVEDYLENLKKGVENLPNDNAPSTRQSHLHLKSELNDIYNTISDDDSLEEQEKARLLTKVREIQIMLPAPQLRPLPRRRDRRRGGIVEHQQNQPAREIAGESEMCLCPCANQAITSESNIQTDQED